VFETILKEARAPVRFRLPKQGRESGAEAVTPWRK